jgi:glycine betaine catabolism B
MKPLRIIDDYLNQITMYRLVVYGLLIIAAAAVVLTFTGDLSLSSTGLLVSAGLLVATCYVANKFIAWGWQVASNSESWLITALILFLILPPAGTAQRALGIVLAGLLAMASKYLIARHRTHLFNPAAFAAVVVGLLGVFHATWWVGTPVLLPLTLTLGLLVARKLRQLWVVSMFIAVSLLVMLLIGLTQHQAPGHIIATAFISWPLIFLGTIMLTEPSTMPSQLSWQLVYAALIGAIFASQTHLGNLIASTPEIAIVLGNVFAYSLNPRYKMRLRLQTKTQLSAQVFDFAFVPDRAPTFLPGQYMEWTLPHRRVDSRGNRRTFTIASSPTEKEVHLGVKIYTPSSSFKKALLAMEPGDTLIAGQVAGDFVLPRDNRQKLVFIAGGIGVTPFRSMLQYLMDTQQRREIILFYLVSTEEEISYHEVVEAAKVAGVRVITLIGERLTPQLITQNVPDFLACRFYVSGPQMMVQRYKDLLRSLQVQRSHIVEDYFSGY